MPRPIGITTIAGPGNTIIAMPISISVAVVPSVTGLESGGVLTTTGGFGHDQARTARADSAEATAS